jgi:hypothetical protein
MEIPAYKQNLYKEFLSRKRGIIMNKNKSIVMGLVLVVVMQIPAYTQKLNQGFLSQKRVILILKSKPELWDLCQSS